jgi:hypothetical protein
MVELESQPPRAKQHPHAALSGERRLNFPVAIRYHCTGKFLTGKLNAVWWQILKPVFQT